MTTRSTALAIERATLLDIATAGLGEAPAGAPTFRACGDTVGPRRIDGLLVADLSSLWAGPLCGQLLAVADVVIESSRLAALQRRRLDPANVAGSQGRSWLRTNRYHDQPNRPTFGDDAAVAGGLVGGGPVCFGDSIADPLSALEAAGAIGEALRRGGGETIDVAMGRWRLVTRSSRAARDGTRATAGRRQRRGRTTASRKVLIQRAVTLDGATVDISG